MTSDLRAQLQRALGAAYTIERELDGGGMSRVFVARETALNRLVVVKVLPTELAGGVSAERFGREIQVAASLQQANIVPLLSAGDADGVPYFTMPFVEGESLRHRLGTGEPLSIAACLSIARDVARALSFAHTHGVVHRDIKPDNVLLSHGAAMVTDFGIAKAVSAARTQSGAATLTQAGTSLGTPARPENADEVLVELDAVTTGSRTAAAPARFSRGGLATAVIAVALVAAVVLTAVRGRTSKAGGDASSDAAATRDRSVAVLPLENLSGDKADNYFGVGLSEEIARALSKIGVRVIGRVSAAALQAKGRAVIAQMRAVCGGKTPPLGVLAATLYELGDRGQAVALLAEAIKAHDGWTNNAVRADLLDHIRQDPRAAAMLDKVGTW